MAASTWRRSCRPRRSRARRATATTAASSRIRATGSARRAATWRRATSRPASRRWPTRSAARSGSSSTRPRRRMTMKLIATAGATANAQSKAAKEFFKRLRPYPDREAARRARRPSELKGSYDYPSGHTTWGWTWALILANLAPDRATRDPGARPCLWRKPRGVRRPQLQRDRGRAGHRVGDLCRRARPARIPDRSRRRARRTRRAARRSGDAQARKMRCRGRLVALPIL